MTVYQPGLAGLSAQISVDRPAKVSWYTDTFLTSRDTPSVLKCYRLGLKRTVVEMHIRIIICSINSLSRPSKPTVSDKRFVVKADDPDSIGYNL